MTQIRIQTIPTKTAKGPVHDFEQAVLAEQPYLNLNALYWFEKTAVHFYVRAGKTGARFYKPHKDGGFVIYKISTSGKRELVGKCEREYLVNQTRTRIR